MDEIDIKQEFRSSKFRWFVTVLAILNVVYLGFIWFSNDEAAMYFPVQLKGKVVLIIMSVTTAIFVSLAAITWTIFLRNKK